MWGAWTLAITGLVAQDEVTRVWSGDGTLVLDGESWASSDGLVSVGRATIPSEGVSSLEVSVDGSSPLFRSLLLQDKGPLRCEVAWLVSDTGLVWNNTSFKFVGRLSAPVISNNAYTFEIEPFGGFEALRRAAQWSHESQQARYAGDNGFEFARRMSHVGITTYWPP